MIDTVLLLPIAVVDGADVLLQHILAKAHRCTNWNNKDRVEHRQQKPGLKITNRVTHCLDTLPQGGLCLCLIHLITLSFRDIA